MRGRAAERAEPDDDVVDARRRSCAPPRASGQQPAADVEAVVLHRREPAVPVAREDMPRCTDSQIAQSCRLTRSHSSPASLGSKPSAAPPRRRRTAASRPRRCGRRLRAAARTRRRGRPRPRASGSGRPGRPCAACARPRSSPGSGGAGGGAGHGERPGALAVRDAVVPVEVGRRRRRTTAPAGTARGAPVRSGSTRCSSRAAPCSWRRRRRSASRR